LATQTRARENQRAHQHLQRPVTARVHRQQAHQNLSHAKMVAEVAQISEQPQQTTAAHASLALLRVHRPRVGKTAHRALSTVTHAQLVTRAIHATHARQPVATSVATGAQHLLLAAATFSAMTVHHAELAKTVRLALSTVTHAHRATRVTVAVVSKTDQQELSIVTHARLAMAQHLVVSKIVRPELLTATHAQHVTHVRLAMVTHVRHALLTVTHAHRATIVHHALSTATHAQHLALSTEQNHADHASLMTALASSTATTATTAPTVVQTVLTA
jgi:hypothetical protein